MPEARREAEPFLPEAPDEDGGRLGEALCELRLGAAEAHGEVGVRRKGAPEALHLGFRGAEAGKRVFKEDENHAKGSCRARRTDVLPVG